MKKLYTFLVFSLTTLSLYGSTTTPTGVTSYTNNDLTNPNPVPTVTNTPLNSVNSTVNTANGQAQTALKYPDLSPEKRQAIVSQMTNLVQSAENRVQSMTALATDRTRMPMSFDKVQLENAIINLNVKKTLIEKFATSPSLKSPKVVAILLQVLGKDDIQMQDLAELQGVVDAERPLTYP